jgi:hypothetical protein
MLPLRTKAYKNLRWKSIPKTKVDWLSTQRYHCVVIPPFIDIGAVWKALQPGIHEATFQEIEERFATNETRRLLFEGFRAGAEALMKAQRKTVYLDGSFVTEKDYPGDFDLCWDPVGVDDTKLDPVLLDFSEGRRKQKAKFGGEFFPTSAKADGVFTFLEFFQHDRDIGKEKGILRIRLG